MAGQPAGAYRRCEVVGSLALREEHVQLRELNVQLSEKEIQKRRELQDLDRVRETLAQEVQDLERSRNLLQEKHAAEQLELERRQDTMKDKLLRCRDAVAFAVGSIDMLYSEQDQPDVVAPPASPLRLEPASPSSVVAAKALAIEAGAEVSAALATLQEETEEDEDPGQENTASIIAGEGYTIDSISASKKVDALTTPERAPLSARNQHL